ncbi:MarR family winged helix-turn-helix transcriptional regulator [Aestuariispira insulae]|uniref:MarR family transcriptional regulator n=1 Tax=Aestuariispira insulae TaxID=1461337 RepID=A0A3D9HGM7_9PROT|nr:MarR family transcriptional regulator [Aestuariispira insulae]RED48620.1 MarR family transcriptional regulator [Aestuariispira insulae]
MTRYYFVMTTETDSRLAALLYRLVGLVRSREQATILNPVQWEALRYLHWANRFSASPKGATEYLGSTKGTVSQTLIALEKKGLIEKRQDAEDKRKIHLVLTPAGQELLTQDPQALLEEDLKSLPEDQRRLMEEAMENLLRVGLQRSGGKRFGFCRSCRHFREDAEEGAPYFCSLLGEPLAQMDADRICLEHDAA